MLVFISSSWEMKTGPFVMDRPSRGALTFGWISAELSGKRWAGLWLPHVGGGRGAGRGQGPSQKQNNNNSGRMQEPSRLGAWIASQGRGQQSGACAWQPRAPMAQHSPCPRTALRPHAPPLLPPLPLHQDTPVRVLSRVPWSEPQPTWGAGDWFSGQAPVIPPIAWAPRAGLPLPQVCTVPQTLLLRVPGEQGPRPPHTQPQNSNL